MKTYTEFAAIAAFMLFVTLLGMAGLQSASAIGSTGHTAESSLAQETPGVVIGQPTTVLTTVLTTPKRSSQNPPPPLYNISLAMVTCHDLVDKCRVPLPMVSRFSSSDSTCILWWELGDPTSSQEDDAAIKLTFSVLRDGRVMQQKSFSAEGFNHCRQMPVDKASVGHYQTKVEYEGISRTVDWDVLPPAAETTVSVWVEPAKSNYRVGEQLTVCFAVSQPIYIRLSSCVAGGGCRVVVQWYDDGYGDCLIRRVGQPAGRREIRIEAMENGTVVAQDSTMVTIVMGE